MPATLAALFFTVALLVNTAYFILGSVPLLVLKHDTPMDSRFVRGFFNIYYKAALFTALGAAASYAVAGLPGLAAGAGALAALSVILKRNIIAKMDELRAKIQLSSEEAIAGFRRTHVLAIGINMAQLALIVWTLITFSVR